MVNSEFSIEDEYKNPLIPNKNRLTKIDNVLSFLGISDDLKPRLKLLLNRLGINTGEEVFMTRRSLDNLVSHEQVKLLISEGILVPDELWSRIGIETERTPYTLDINTIYDLEKAAELEEESGYIL